VGRTGNQRWLQVRYEEQLAWVDAKLLDVSADLAQVPVVKRDDFPATPTPKPTRTPRPTHVPRIPRPILVEPRGGARFGDTVVRYKFTWIRRLEPDERISLHIRTEDGLQVFDWWVSEEDILNGGGAIHEEEGRIRYEVNSGFGRLPRGRLYWKVGVFLDAPDDKRQISPWSMERRILKR
jgi:hypothetical protein